VKDKFSGPVRIGFVDALNIVGSVASITGISLLWIKDLTGSIDWGLVSVVALIVPAQFGLLSGLVWLLMAGYQKFVSQHSVLIKVFYFGIGGPAIPICCFAAAALVNKIVISINWEWFFSR
jgi:hypothetical protein